MRTLYLKDSSNRRKEFALTTKICIENGKKIVVKEACYPEGIPHLKRIVESQRLFAKYYKNVKICKTWIENDKFYSEFIDGKQLSDYYIKAIQNNDKEEIIKLIKFHLKLALGQDNICKFKSSDGFNNLFGETNVFEGKPALNFTFFDPLPENIIFRNGDFNKPYFIDYEWFFNFPIPISLLKFRIVQQLSMIEGINDIISLKERFRIVECELSFNDAIIYFNKFADFVYKKESIKYQFINKNFEKNILQLPEIITYYGNIYFNTGEGYSDKNNIVHSFTGNEIDISCQIPENTIAIRLDPIEKYGCVISNLEVLSYGGIVEYEPVNGYRDKNNDLVFVNPDPQIEINGVAHWIKIKYRILPLLDLSLYRVFSNYVYTTQDRDNLATEKNSIIVEYNKLAAERDNIIAKYPELKLQNITLFFNTGMGYSEDNKIVHTFTGNEIKIYFEIPKNTIAIRLDPIENYGCVISNIELISFKGIVNYDPINGYKDKNGNLVFVNDDPQIELYGAEHWIKINYRIMLLSNYSHYKIFDNFIDNSRERKKLEVEKDCLIEERDGLIAEQNNLTAERDGLIAERNNLTAERDGLITERNNLTAERDNLIAERNDLIAERYKLVYENTGLMAERDRVIIERESLLNSRSWRFTKPLRDFTAFIRRHKILRLFAKGLLSLKRKGIIETIKKVVNYKRRPSLTQVFLLDKLSASDNTPIYESEYQKNIDFSKYEPKVKAIAFYLPQFHTIPENDKWWGEGFTEWTNTRKAKPRFNDHYQPREPHRDIGYYDLKNIDVLKKQAKLAKQHGIYGFCFYLYWFSGKRLLEKPLDLLLNHPEIDINFCLCWANENWTRRWDGMDQEILIKQIYADDEPYKFIEDMQKYINDKRYIKIDGSPIILVYYPGHIPNVRDVFIKWKKHANEIGIGKIKILVCETWGHTAKSLNIDDIVDGLVEFPPHHMQNNAIYYDKDIATICSYKNLVTEIKEKITKNNNASDTIPLYHTCMLGWDNSARKKNAWITFIRFSLKSFYEWVESLVNDAIQTKKSIFFINAWNEWGEGTYLEPDKKYGYANINTLSKAICEIPFEDNHKNDSNK
jgi:hypothetical protein